MLVILFFLLSRSKSFGLNVSVQYNYSGYKVKVENQNICMLCGYTYISYFIVQSFKSLFGYNFLAKFFFGQGKINLFCSPHQHGCTKSKSRREYRCQRKGSASGICTNWSQGRRLSLRFIKSHLAILYLFWKKKIFYLYGKIILNQTYILFSLLSKQQGVANSCKIEKNSGI